MKNRNQGQGSTRSTGAPANQAPLAVETQVLRIDEAVVRSQWIRVQLIKSLMDVAPGRQTIRVSLNL
jgi:hypothetical protein